MSSERNINKFRNSETDKKEIRSKFNILLVEDNSTNQMIAVNLLESAGYSMLTADNGQKAVDLFKNNQEKIDLILMDLHMPIKNGYQAAAEIREVSELPIIAMSADVIEGVKKRCRNVGIFDYISKPFVPEELIKKLDQILNFNEYQDNNEPSDNLKEKQGNAELIKQKDKIIDFKRSLAALGLNKSIYKEILESYYQENKELAVNIKNLIESDQYQEAADLVHKFKGSTGSIGADKMYQLAVEFQKALKNENYEQIKDLESRFEARLETLLEEIADYL